MVYLKQFKRLQQQALLPNKKAELLQYNILIQKNTISTVFQSSVGNRLLLIHLPQITLTASNPSPRAQNRTEQFKHLSQTQA